nr:MAG TPA_asm: hypothetical protein [Caudoviricetes sp.]
MEQDDVGKGNGLSRLIDHTAADAGLLPLADQAERHGRHEDQEPDGMEEFCRMYHLVWDWWLRPGTGLREGACSSGAKIETPRRTGQKTARSNPVPRWSNPAFAPPGGSLPCFARLSPPPLLSMPGAPPMVVYPGRMSPPAKDRHLRAAPLWSGTPSRPGSCAGRLLFFCFFDPNNMCF